MAVFDFAADGFVADEVAMNLAVVMSDRPLGLSKEQGELLDALFAHNGLAIAEAERMSGRPRRSVQRDFRELADKGLAQLVGQTRSVRWVPVRDALGAKASGSHHP